MKFFAGIAQLVEHNLAKVGVASSSLVSRSKVLLSGIGWVAEWLCSGLQSLGRRFDSGLSLQSFKVSARVAKLVDARDLKSLGCYNRAGSTPASGTIFKFQKVFIAIKLL